MTSENRMYRKASRIKRPGGYKIFESLGWALIRRERGGFAYHKKEDLGKHLNQISLVKDFFFF